MATDAMTEIIDMALIGLTVTDAASNINRRDANKTIRSLQEVYTKDEILESLIYALGLIITIDASQNGIRKNDVINVYRDQFLRMREMWAVFDENPDSD